MSLLPELRAHGYRIRRGPQDQLYLAGPLDPGLVDQVRARKPELLAELELEAALVSWLYACPGCGSFDYQPSGGRRRCLVCRRLYQDSQDRQIPLPTPVEEPSCWSYPNSLGLPVCMKHRTLLDNQGYCPVSKESCGVER